MKYYPIKKSEYGFIALSDPKIERLSLVHDETTTRTILHLTPNSYYRLELIAHNELGDSEVAWINFRTSPSDLTSGDELDNEPL